MKHTKLFLTLLTVAFFVAAAWIVVQRASAQDAAAETPVAAVTADEAAPAVEAPVPVAAKSTSEAKFVFFWIFSLACSAAALYYAFQFYKEMKAADPGTPKMIEIAAAVQKGAYAYLRQQYKIVALFFLVMFIFFGV